MCIHLREKGQQVEIEPPQIGTKRVNRIADGVTNSVARARNDGLTRANIVTRAEMLGVIWRTYMLVTRAGIGGQKVKAADPLPQEDHEAPHQGSTTDLTREPKVKTGGAVILKPAEIVVVT